MNCERKIEKRESIFFLGSLFGPYFFSRLFASLLERPFGEVLNLFSVSLTLTAVVLFVYFGFILTVAFYKDLLAYKIGEHLTIGLPIGIGIILFAWLLTGLYTYWANHSYDKSVREFRDQILKK